MNRVPEFRREMVFDRDNRQCIICLRGPEDGVTLECHHRIPLNKGGTHEPSNLITVCERHHQLIHRSHPPQEGLPRINPDEYEISLSPVDQDIIAVIKRHGAMPTRKIAEIAGVSERHMYRRLHRLMAYELIDRTEADKLWDEWDNIPDWASIRKTWPEKPRVAAALGRGDVMAKLHERGYSLDKIADIVDIDEQSVEDAITRVEALNPPFSKGSNSSETTEQTGQTEISDATT